MKIRIPFLVLVAIFGIVSNVFAISNLEKLDSMSTRLLSIADVHEMDYAIPQWLTHAELVVGNSTSQELMQWNPSSLKKIEVGNVSLFYSIWKSDKLQRLIGVARRHDVDVDMLPLSFAFADDLPATGSTLFLKQVSADGLDGVCVIDSLTAATVYTIPDMLCRMDLTTISDMNYTISQKQGAADELDSRLGKAHSVLAGDLSGFPLLTVADSPDERVRFVTYYVARKDFVNRCGGWLLTFNKKKLVSVKTLTDSTPTIGNAEQATLTPTTWYGALYSRIIPFKVNRRTYYALVGFKGANAVIKTRVLDFLSIEDDEVKFGVPVLLHPQNNVYRRRIFQYSVKASMSISYDEKSKMIVYDHLAPSETLLTGQFAFYGPDLSYDAYLLTDKGWEFQADIQMTKEDGAQPNPEMKETQSDKLTQPANGGGRRNTYSGSYTPSFQQGRRNSGGSKGSTWFDKGKGNNSPTSRKR